MLSIKTPNVENLGLTMEKNVQPKARDEGNVINGTTGNKYVEVNEHRTGKTSHHIDHHLKVENHRASPIRIGYM